MNSRVIEVHNVHKRFSYSRHKNNSLKRAITQIFKKKDRGEDEFYALNGISFNVEQGDFFGILGRNGSGKSTLLKIISEIYRPTTGTVRHRGKLVSFIELGVGFKAELSGKENVYLNGAMLGFSKDEIDEMYDDIVSFAELEKFMDQTLKNYSSGMKVRLAFSVAIRAKADILILDEVLAVGDAAFQRKCYEYFKSLKDEHKTVVLVTHSMGAVREYCNKAILIEEGKIVHQGEASAVADEYLKLFNKSSDETDKTGGRWGSKEIVIDGVQVKATASEVEVVAKLTASKKISSVKFGFRIKEGSAKGKVIAGINNLNAIHGAQKLNFKEGETKTLCFTMPNVFGSQRYVVSATANLSDGATTFDDWENAASFSTTKDNVFYPVVCPAELIINP